MRFAGSKIDFQGPTVTGGPGSSSAAAANAVDIGNSFGAQREKAPRYDELSSAAMQTQSAEKRAAMDAEGYVMANGMQALSQAKSGQMQAQATIKAAEAEAEAAKSSAMMGSFGQIASAGLSLIPGLG